MKDYHREALENIIKSAERSATNEALDIVKTKIWSKLDQIDRLLTSDTAMNLLITSYGEKFQQLFEKRRILRIKYGTLSEIYGEIVEIGINQQ